MSKHTTTSRLTTQVGSINPWLMGVLATSAAAAIISTSVLVFAKLDAGADSATGAPAPEHTPAHAPIKTAAPAPRLDCSRYLAEARKEGGAIARDGLLGSAVGAAVGAAGGALVDGKHSTGKGAAIGALAGGVAGSVRKNEMENKRLAQAERRYADCLAQS